MKPSVLPESSKQCEVVCTTREFPDFRVAVRVIHHPFDFRKAAFVVEVTQAVKRAQLDRRVLG